MAASDVGNITGSFTQTASGSCRTGGFSAETILKYGKSLPLIELFETFMIIGLVLMAVFAANYYAFHNISAILKSDGGTQSSINVVDAAAHTQPVWIAIGAVFFIIGVVLYFLHRRIAAGSS